MTVNAIAISSRLRAAGLEKEAADAVASEIVDFNDDRAATKIDIANIRTVIVELNGKIDRVEAKIDAKFNLMLGLMSAFFIAFVVDKII